MQNTNKISNIVITILVIITVAFAYLYFSTSVKLRDAEQTVASQKINDQILSFSQLFFDKVLQGNKTVSFDDRLQLENSVRALNDKEIFDSWTKFTNAKDQAEVQKDFYDLFGLLLGKIKG